MKSNFVLFCALFLSACATQKSNYDFLAGTDFSRYQSYAWLTVDKEAKDNQRAKNQLVNKRIMDAVDKSLAAKGLQKASDNPDMMSRINTACKIRWTVVVIASPLMIYLIGIYVSGLD